MVVMSRTATVLQICFYCFLLGFTHGSFIPHDVCQTRGNDCLAAIKLPSFLHAGSLDENGNPNFTCDVNIKAQARACLAIISEECVMKSFQSLLSMSDVVCNNSQVFVSGAECWMHVFYGTELSFCGFCHPDCFREHAADLRDCTEQHAELLYKIMSFIAEGESCQK